MTAVRALLTLLVLFLPSAVEASGCYGRSAYYAAGYYGGRYFPAGHYSYVNGSWYRHGYGYEYGSAHCPPAAVILAAPDIYLAARVSAATYPPPAAHPTAALAAEVARLLQMAQPPGVQPPAPTSPPPEPEDEIARLRKEIAELKQLLQQK